MNIAHVGATGKVGSKILAELLRRGHSVTVISRRPEQAPGDKRVKTLIGDITQPAALAQSLAGHDAIVISVTARPRP